jgi:hypothetical protein
MESRGRRYEMKDEKTWKMRWKVRRKQEVVGGRDKYTENREGRKGE